jgi:hypothetical protein
MAFFILSWLCDDDADVDEVIDTYRERNAEADLADVRRELGAED